MDAALGLPDKKHSLEVRRRVAEESARASFDEVVDLIAKGAGAHVPKRQIEELAVRKARDEAISNDPIARDFFHVFWSRYYEWSPGVARIASQDRAVARHIQWGFLDPWMAWLEFAAAVGRRSMAELSEAERQDIMRRLGTRLESWLAALPTQMEGKTPADAAEVFAAFDRFRASLRGVFGA